MLIILTDADRCDQRETKRRRRKRRFAVQKLVDFQVHNWIAFEWFNLSAAISSWLFALSLWKWVFGWEKEWILSPWIVFYLWSICLKLAHFSFWPKTKKGKILNWKLRLIPGKECWCEKKYQRKKFKAKNEVCVVNCCESFECDAMGRCEIH